MMMMMRLLSRWPDPVIEIWISKRLHSLTNYTKTDDHHDDDDNDDGDDDDADDDDDDDVGKQ